MGGAGVKGEDLKTLNENAVAEESTVPLGVMLSVLGHKLVMVGVGMQHC